MMKTIEELLSPIEKLTELNRVQIKKSMDAQQASAKKYVSLAEERFEAAKGIRDVVSFNAFIMDQVEFSRSSMEKMLLDSKAFLTEAKVYNEEMVKLIQEGNAVFKNKINEIKAIKQKPSK
ncbi:MAG: phasin family protein [Cycloclasticus sp.]|jgi:phasin family protein|nr:MAG: hypothetical protein AXW16_01195 [Cycloclasticus sp. Phe_18]MBV1912655.1 phasin family protein [Cycloclasticus sp.]MDF1688297.1 phasin family protein [Cycloclasticus sp.]MEE4290828.1 phasin family protein [Cycloclasticus sp.]